MAKKFGEYGTFYSARAGSLLDSKCLDRLLYLEQVE